jgi:hypothetical protein
MKNRSRISSGKSKRMFRKGASKVKRANFAPKPMRGGFRL